MLDVEIEDHLKTTSIYPLWEKIGVKQHHGIQLLLSSIYSKDSLMIGDFFDLIPLIHWCKEIGFSFIQLLPLQDTGSMTSPYSSLSSLALHPIYIRLQNLPYLDKKGSEPLHEEIKKMRHYKQTKRLDFTAIYKKKIAFLKRYFDIHFEMLCKDPKFEKFIQKHDWLKSYSVYSALAEKFGSNLWKSWPKAYHEPKKEDIDRWEQENKQTALFYKFCQYICFNQLLSVKKVADKAGIFLKGDIPILISPFSSDVWYKRRYFCLEKEVGSKPSNYDPKGQHWGFPSFNWQAHIDDGFSWWKYRLSIMGLFFSMYRIDHCAGLFRLWLIPYGKNPIDGTFYPKAEEEMLKLGQKVLTNILKGSKMLPIAEIMGDPPLFIKETLIKEGVPSLKVIRYPKAPLKKPTFDKIDHLNKLSLSSLSTHDISPMRLWWEEKPEFAKAFAKAYGLNYEKKLSTQIQYEILKLCHSSKSLMHANLLLEYLSVVPELSWEDPSDDVINVPGTENTFNWTYRHKTCIEAMVENSKLREIMRSLV